MASTAAYIVGMPTRNANSVAAGRLDVPNSSAAKIVAPERDVPGNTPAIICAMPTRIATGQVTLLRSGMRAATCSAAIIQTPPITSAHAIGVIVSGSLKPSFTAMKPSTAVIRNATVNFSR